VLVTATQQFNGEPYIIEISTLAKRLYINAENVEKMRKFVVEIPEDKGKRPIQPHSFYPPSNMTSCA
jgi:hypothetical protein